MDPLYKALPPKQTGKVALADGMQLYYELRGQDAAPNGRIVFLNGAFGTLRHYDELADAMAAAGYQSLCFDYRHIGRSRAGPAEHVTPNQTSELLGRDALELLDAVWPGQSVHVYGASMGGFLAQRLALLLAPLQRLASLYIGASSRGMRWWPHVNSWCFRKLLPLTIKHPVERMTQQLVRDSFSKEYLSTVSNDPAAQGATMRELWERRWCEQYADCFAFCDVEACAGQAPLAVSHYLSDADAAAIASSGTPTTMYVAGRDAMIPPAAQRKLGQLLGARVLDTQSSHMEASMAALEELPRHLAWAASGGGAAQPGATAGGS